VDLAEVHHPQKLKRNRKWSICYHKKYLWHKNLRNGRF
jgi:hypothetical protein